MKPLVAKPDDLSDKAFEILTAAYENYQDNNTKYFDDFDRFGLSRDDLDANLKELRDNKYVIWQEAGGGQDEWILILPHKLLLQSDYNK